MKYIYTVNESKITCEDGRALTRYGITARAADEDTPCRTVCDIFSDRDEAENFVIACNVLGLDIDHLDDVIYDAINA